MGRFYRTAKSEFIDDMIYQPPWVLAQQALAVKQQGYDDALKTTELFKDLLDVKHLEFEDDRAKQVKEYYNSKIDDITNQLAQNPNDYNKVLPQIRNLTRELDIDRKEGQIADIEGRYNAYANWIKSNEDLAKKEPGTYNMLQRHWYEDVKSRATDDVTAQFLGVRGVQKPELEWEKVMKDIKANEVTVTNGKYYIGTEEVSEERIQELAWNRLKSNPDFAGYINQMGNVLGLEAYKVDPFELRDSKGNVVTPDQYSKMSDEDKKKVQRYTNPASAFASDIEQAVGISAYRKSEVKKADEYGLAGYKGQVSSALQAQKDAASMQRLLTADKGKFDRLLKEYELRGELEKLKATLDEKAKAGDKKAGKKLEEIEAKATFGIIGSNNQSYDKNLAAVVAGDVDAIQNEQNSRDAARKALGYKKDTEEHDFLQFVDAKLASGNMNIEEIAREFATQKMKSEHEALEGYALDTANPARYQSRKEAYEMGFQNRVNKVKDIYDAYKNAKESYFNRKYTAPVAMEPVTKETNQALVQTLNLNKSSFYTTDKNGDREYGDEALKTVKSVQRVFGSNPKERLGMQVLFEDGTTGYVFPGNSKNGGTHVNTIKNLILDNGLSNKNTYLHKQLIDGELENLTSRFSNTMPDNSGIKKVLYSVSDGRGGTFNIPIHQIGGQYYVVDPNDPSRKVPYSDLSKIIETIHK
jgi:hypothetical protein